jgi:hypothetical protein
MNDEEEISEFDAVDYWLHENIVPGPWSLLTDVERKMLTDLAKHWLSFETLEERGRDRLDFQEVAVWSVRVALARAFLAGAQRMPP